MVSAAEVRCRADARRKGTDALDLGVWRVIICITTVTIGRRWAKEMGVVFEDASVVGGKVGARTSDRLLRDQQDSQASTYS